MPIVRSEQREGFTMVPNRILRNGNLSVTARLVWTVALSRPDDWVFRLESLAADVGISNRTTQRAIAELRDHGAVTGQFRCPTDPITFHQTPSICPVTPSICPVNTTNLSVNTTNLPVNTTNLPVNATNCRVVQDEDATNTTNCRVEHDKNDMFNTTNLPPTNTNNNTNNNTISAAHKLVQATKPCVSESELLAAAAEHNSSEMVTTSSTAWDPDVIDPLPDESPAIRDTSAKWERFLEDWNRSGQLVYTALQPTSVILSGFMRLRHLYGRDGPQKLIDRVMESRWLRGHPKTLEWALREQNVTKIMDGHYQRDFRAESTMDHNDRKTDRTRDVPDYAHIKTQNGEIKF